MLKLLISMALRTLPFQPVILISHTFFSSISHQIKVKQWLSKYLVYCTFSSTLLAFCKQEQIAYSTHGLLS